MGAYRPSEDKDGLANYLEKRPHLRDWDRPTAWLLGTQMISSLRQLILSAIHTGFDLRDWMTAEEGGAVVETSFAGTEYWFDFVADTGDAPALVYCLSRAMQQPELEVDIGNDKTVKLPRGRLLVLGGDSAYPVADQVAIRERWQAPHVWADRANRAFYEKEHATEPPPIEKVPVYAIPGNHDYYDALDGFNRQFRKQATDDDTPSKKHGTPPPLRLPGYSRTQLASYFALKLPFDWHLWGVDLGAHPEKERPIDTRQQEYFNQLGVPEKLIVVTALPVAVHHAYAHDLVSPFQQLGLEVAFDKQGKLDDKHTRLDLSGDVHLYERYWGTTDAVAGAKVRGDSLPDAAARTNYAAVVSGLGGAFHHPIQVRCDEDAKVRATPQHAWPAEKDSRDHIGDVLTRPRKVFQAGSIGVLGAALGLLFYLLSNRDWGDGPGVLVVPERLWAKDWSGACGAGAQFGLVMMFLGLVVAWGFLAKDLKKGTRKIVDAMLEPRPAENDVWGRRIDAARAWLDRRFGGDKPTGYRARFLRWTGANRRVMTSVILRLPIWLAFLASIASVAITGYFLLRHSRDAGINFAAAILVGGMVAFPFITNEPTLRRGPAFVALGLVHGIAQLYTPQLWAGATVALVVPMFMLAGYWCVRPLPALLFARGKRSRWLTAVWLVLVAVMLVGPMALLRIRLTEWDGWYSIGITVWLVLCLAGIVAARGLVTGKKWDNWRWGVLAAMLVVQVGTLLALPHVHELTSARTEWWLGLVAAVIGGAFFACLWLGWYVAVCLQWSLHGNDAGSVARVDDFAEFLRVRLTATEAEVWAIAVDADFRKTHPLDADTFAGAAHLIDHFKVTAKGP